MPRLAFATLASLAVLPFLTSARALEFSTVQSAGKSATVCRVDLKTDRLELFLRDGSGQFFKTFDAVNASLHPQGRRLAFGMNAGMFHTGNFPVGLCVADGRELFPLNLQPGEGNFFLKPNGVFAVTASGQAQIVESSQYSPLAGSTVMATQSGPLLVLGGRIHPAFNAGSASRLYRNGVGVPSPGVALFAITDEPMNFHEFATLFRNVLHCPDALFLDGTLSSLFSERLKRNDKKMDLGPMIGVTEAIDRLP